MKVQGGEFQVPPRLLADVESFLLEAYCSHILWRLEEQIAAKQNPGGRLEEVLKEVDEQVKTLWSKLRELPRGGVLRFNLYDVSSATGVRGKSLLGVKRLTENIYFIAEGKAQLSFSRPLLDYSSVNDTHQYLERKLTRNLARVQAELMAARRQHTQVPEHKLVDLFLMRRLCLKYTRRPKRYTTRAQAQVKVNLDGWPYLERLLAKGETRWKKEREEALAVFNQTIKDQDTRKKFHDILNRQEALLDDWSGPERLFVPAPGQEKLYEATARSLGIPVPVPEYFQKYPLVKPAGSLDIWVDTSPGKKNWYNQESIKRFQENETYTEQVQLGRSKFDKIWAFLNFFKHTQRGGLWDVSEKSLEVDAPNQGVATTLDALRAGIREIRRIARHEVQHVAQSLIEAFTATQGGLPAPAVRDPRYTPSGHPVKNPGRGRVDHPLRDVEYQTRLSDEIHYFMSRAREFPANERRKLFDGVVGLDPSARARDFFKALKVSQPAKWRRAVAEFWKLVQDAGARIPAEAPRVARTITAGDKSAGVFIRLPENLARKFPSLGSEDTSPPHVTFLIVGALGPGQLSRLRAVVADLVAGQRPVTARLAPAPDYFVNPARPGRVAYMPVRFDAGMAELRWRLRDRLVDDGFEVADYHPLVYNAHATLAYLDGLDTPYEGPVPQGEFKIEALEIWNGEHREAVPFGRSKTSSSPVIRELREGVDEISNLWSLLEARETLLQRLIGSGEARRLDRVQKVKVGEKRFAPDRVTALVEGGGGDYRVRITFSPRPGHSCTCLDWRRSAKSTGPCKHVLALALDVANGYFRQAQEFYTGQIQHLVTLIRELTHHMSEKVQ